MTMNKYKKIVQKKTKEEKYKPQSLKASYQKNRAKIRETVAKMKRARIR